MAEREDKMEDRKFKQPQKGKVKSASRRDTLSTPDVNKQCHDYSNNVDIALAKFGTQYNTIGHTSTAGTDMGKALPEQSEKICGIRDRTQDLSEEDSQLERDKYLLKHGVITKEQFKRKWGSKE